MDPNACLEMFCDALLHDDSEAAEESANNLLAWLDNGGIMPTVDKSQLCTLLNNLLIYVEITDLTGEATG